MSYFRENIERLSGYTPGAQPEGKDVVKLNTNENPYPPSPLVSDVIRNFDPAWLRRYPSPVGGVFRKAAAKLNGVNEDNIICTNGGDDLLTIAFRAFCDKDRVAAFPTPTYTLYDELAALQDCPVVKPDIEDDRLFEKLTDSGASLVILCNPNAPTGGFFPPKQVAELANALKGKAVLLIDEAYADFAGNNCAGLVKDFENVIILRSLSKGYSLAGLRFGYGIADVSIIKGLMKLKDSYNVDALSIKIAAAAVSDSKYFKHNIELVVSQRKRLREQLLKLGFDVPESYANFLFAKAPNRSAAELFDRLQRKNIYVRYFPYKGIDDKLRITVGTEKENSRLLEALKDIL